MPLQGSAADIVKVAMIRTYQSLKKRGLKAKLILQVHDELIIDCPKSELEEVKEIVRDSMENAYKLNVPLTVDVEASYRWSDGH
jgi:DNA polymerase-1